MRRSGSGTDGSLEQLLAALEDLLDVEDRGGVARSLG
jgi:hypothetical protein